MKKLLALVITLAVLGSGVAVAHQPVVLLNSDTTAAKGPLLVDGTVSRRRCSGSSILDH